MAQIITLPTIKDERGSLTVIEKILPFSIKRVFYIYDVNSPRGGHAHKKCLMALIALKGVCQVFVDNGEKEEQFILSSPSECLLLDPQDWHTMEFKEGAILLVLASEYYDKEDYVFVRKRDEK